MKFKELREKYKSKYPAALVAAAVKIAIDMGGAMTPAVKKIEAMKRGLSDDPIVKDALRMANESVKEESIEEAKAPKIKGLSIYGSEISGLKNKKGAQHTAKPLVDRGKLAFRVTDEFGSFKTVDLKTFAKEFG